MQIEGVICYTAAESYSWASVSGMGWEKARCIVVARLMTNTAKERTLVDDAKGMERVLG